MIYKKLTKEQKEEALKQEAEKDSVFLANDLIVSLEREQRVFEVSEIRDADNFKRIILGNIESVWKELTDDEEQYYYQQLHLFISNQQEKENYIERLKVLAADDVIKRFLDYIDKHKDTQKVLCKYN